MPYLIRAENDEFSVYDQESDEYLGVLSCPFEQTEDEFVQEMNEAALAVIGRDDIANIDDFDLPELKAWSVFAIDSDPDDEVDGDDIDD